LMTFFCCFSAFPYDCHNYYTFTLLWNTFMDKWKRM